MCEEKDALSPPARGGTQLQLYGAQEKAVLVEFDKILKKIMYFSALPASGTSF
jgi:hypothetical protein